MDAEKPYRELLLKRAKEALEKKLYVICYLTITNYD